MKKILSGIFCLIGLMLASTPAMAVGIGVYGDFVRGVDHYGGDLGGDLDVTYDFKGASGGLIIDTAAAKDELLNYRLRLGMGKITGPKKPFTGISMIHTFGFSPTHMNGKNVRFWFGPRIGLHYIYTKFTQYFISDEIMLMQIYNPYMYPFIGPMMILAGGMSKTKLDFFKGDIGLVFAGFNFNFGDHLTLSVELGFDYGFRIGKVSPKISKGDAFGEGLEGFGALSFMFRINDTHAVNERLKVVDD